MRKTVFNFVVFTTLSLTLQTSLDVALDMRIAPNEVNLLEPNKVEIFCQVGLADDLQVHVKEITLFQLQKEDSPIATILKDSELCLAKDLKSNFKAEGNITTPISNSHIRVTLTNPERDDFTNYKCVLYFLDVRGFLRGENRTMGLALSKLDPFVVQNLAGQLTSVQEQMMDYRAKLESHANVSSARESLLQDRISSLTSQIDSQEKKIADQDLKIGQIAEHGTATVLFTAVYTQRGGPFSGVLKFQHVLVNEGGGFNKETGIFTAPFAGYYLLHVSVLANDNTYIYIDLKTGDGKILTRMKAGRHQGREDYSDGSCIAKLDAGEDVMPVARSATSGFTMYGLDTYDPMNKFYGYLLKTV